MVDEKIHIGIALGNAAYVYAGRVFVRAHPEGQALVDRDVFHTELDGFFDELDADFIIEEEAFAVGSPLGVGLPGGDFVACGKFVHRLNIARRIRIDAPMDVETVAAFEALDNLCRRERFLDGQGLVLAR